MKNVIEAERALVEKPLFATSAERFLILDEIKYEYKDLPQPLRFSKMLSELLDRVSVPLEDYDLIAGRCVDRLLNEEEESAFQAFIHHPEHPKKDVLLSSGHCTYSWEMVVECGLPGLRAHAEQSAERYACEEEKQIFLKGIIEIYDALERYMLRYAKTAQEMGLTDLAGSLRRSATEKPGSFRDALQLLWIITLVDCAYITENPTLTVGRLDQILWPLYQEDIRTGQLTREQAKALITDYYCKHNLIMGRGEHQAGDESNSTTFRRICNFDAPQYLLLAGTDENGHPAVNDLTHLFAECIRPKFKNPVILVRYFKDMNTAYPDLWRVLTEKSLQSASMMYYNDDNMLRTYEKIGIPIEDTRGYAHFGCNWPTLGENCAWMQGGPNANKFHPFKNDEERQQYSYPVMRTNAEHGWPEDLMIVLRQLQDCADVDIDAVYDGFLNRMAVFVDEKLKCQARELLLRKRKPSAVLNFTDCFLKGSLEKAECFAAGAKYHFQMQSFLMFGTVADCITVVDQLVFRERKLTLKELLDAADANFEGAPHILALCRNVMKYGSDTPLSNAHVKRLSEAFSNIVIEKSRPYLKEMGLFLAPCIQSDVWHLKLGSEYGATPDGRLAHMPFSQNIRPQNGANVNGLTAMLNSVLMHPSDGILSGALNLDINPNDFEGEEGRRRFAAILGVYLNKGGLHAQVTSVRPEDLIDAQIHPEQHRDLRVRVTGYSGVFVDICKNLQDDIIERLNNT